MPDRACRYLAVPATALLLCVLASGPAPADSLPSAATEECLTCHGTATPGILQDWKRSRHAATTLEEALKKPEHERRTSLPQAGATAEPALRTAVGCAECHTRNPESHRDTFEHNGYQVHVVVTPEDCAGCHPREKEEYTGRNKMAHAYGNLRDNALYQKLETAVIGLKGLQNGTLVTAPPTPGTRMDTCYGCHGTRVEVVGTRELDTEFGLMQVPDFSGWPNMGVGRVNPDGSLGSCSACHPRHAFSIAVARQPHVCSQCHLEPDAPAWNVYRESKHGNLYSSLASHWDFDAVPWRLGRDFQAPTCAACHASLIADPEGTPVVERTHGYSDRLWVRLFGLVYSHPQPLSPDTRVIRNQDGLPLPTRFSGEPAASFLIDEPEQRTRQTRMMSLCRGCHSTRWTELHFEKLNHTLGEVDQMVLASTRLMEQAWHQGLASQTDPFDEPLETLWSEQWLFYANSIRYASAMTGAPDYAAFHNGWWKLSRGLRELQEAVSRPRDRRR